ncbi:MAG: VanZ family protein [Alphaproteobacteria bacterium]|nr:VanZ family protein [Alphaproteobacteria bacterium]
MVATSDDSAAGPAASAVRRAARVALVVAAALIVYGSLYPFQFKSSGAAVLGWPARATTSDVLINFLLYMPIGALGQLAAPAAMSIGRRLALIVAFATLLSAGVEVTQAFDAGRHSSRLDVMMNAAGALTGIGFALGLRHAPFWRHLPRETGVGSALFVLGLWLSWRLSPFLVDFSGATVPAAFADFAAHWWPDRPTLLAFAIQWLVVMHLIAALGPQRHVLARAALCLAAISAIRVWMPGRAITAQEVYGFAIAASLWAVGLRQAWVAALALAIQFIDIGLAPAGPWRPRPVNWLPFRSLIRNASELAMQILLGHLFAAGVFVWLLARTGIGYRGAIPIGLGLSIGIEWGQTGVPGRYPDVTDPVIYVVMALALARIETLALPGGRADPRR